MRSWRSGGRSALVTLAVLSLVACGAAAPAGRGRSTPESVGRRWLDRFENAVGPGAGTRPLVQVGSWSKITGHGSARQRAAATDALAAGDVQRAGRLPAAPDGQRTVTWADGTTSTVFLVSAEEAVRAAAVEGRVWLPVSAAGR